LSIAALGIAVVYLLIIVAGVVGALLILVWLFQDTPDANRGTEREVGRGLRNAERVRSGSTSSDEVASQHQRDQAA
jgi:hypothetical protein